MKKVLVFGTFDGLHEGHKELFRQAGRFGNYLIVVIARDSTVLQNKGRSPKFNELERKREVEKCDLVNEVILGEENHNTENDQYLLVEKILPDIICLGYDQEKFKKKLQKELDRMKLSDIKIYILEAFKPEIYKSTLLNRTQNQEK